MEDEISEALSIFTSLEIFMPIIIKIIREINKRRSFNVAILVDLQGPKLRVGVMGEKVKLKEGDSFTFTTDKCEGDSEKAYMTYQNFPKDVKAGEHILVDDGKLLFEVIELSRSHELNIKIKRNRKIFFMEVFDLKIIRNT